LSQANKKYDRQLAPAPPLFLGAKEKKYQKQINDQLIETVLPFQILYFPIDIDTTNFHSLYGEAIEKNFLNPIVVRCIVEWAGEQTETTGYGIDRKASPIKIYFHKRRLVEDQNLYVRMGDFVQYGDNFYEIIDLNETRELFGDNSFKVEISATCIRAREELFNGQF